MKITFEGLPTTADWHTAYSNVGVTFSGGILEQNLANHYIVGPTIMRFDPALALSWITFRGDAWGPDNMLESYVSGVFYEPTLFESGSWTPTGKIDGWQPGMMFPGRIFSEGLVDEIHFTTTLLDDIEFVSRQAPAAAVPEPSGLLSIAIGLTALLWSIRNVRTVKKA